MPSLATLLERAERAEAAAQAGPRMEFDTALADESWAELETLLALLRGELEDGIAFEHRLRAGDAWLREHEPKDDGYVVAQRLHAQLDTAGLATWVRVDELWKQAWRQLGRLWIELQHLPLLAWPEVCQPWHKLEPVDIWPRFGIGLPARAWPMTEREVWIAPGDTVRTRWIAMAQLQPTQPTPRAAHEAAS